MQTGYRWLPILALALGSIAVALGAAARGLLFKRTAYNFVSLAHDEGTVDRALAMLHEALRAV